MRYVPVCAIFLLAGLMAAPPVMAQAPLSVDPRSAPFNARFDGKSDDTVALNAAFVAAAANRAGAVVRLPGNATIKVSGNLTFDVSRASLDCQGATLDATGATSGATFNLTTTNRSPNLMAGIHNAHPVQNCFLDGPDSNTGVDAFHFASNKIESLSWMTGMVIDRVSATGYRNFIQTGPGTVALTVQNGTYGSNARHSGTFWDVVAGDNTGEAFRAVNFFVANASACFNDHGSNGSNVDIYAVNFSCDGVNYVLTGGAEPGKGTSLMTLFYTGHIEAVLARDYAINISNGGFDFLSGEWIGTQAGQQTHTMCKVTSAYSGEEMGVRIGDVEFGDQTGTFVPGGGNRFWCDGSGPFRVTGAAALGNTAVGLFAYSNNRIANYANPSRGDFQIAGNVTSDSTIKPAGAASSLHLVASSSASLAVAVTPCEPGVIAAAAATIRSAGVTANHGTAGIQIGYLDKQGNLLASNEIGLKADVPVFTAKQVVPVQLPAPPGTAFCRAQFAALSPGGGVQVWVAYPQLIVQ
jgi:hypothetical protein